MCSLCGIMGGQSHWVDPASNPKVFGVRTQDRTWHRERQDQSRLVNQILKHYSLSASDWKGNAFVVKSPTGKTELAENISQVWTAAETILGQSCDPLDDDLIAKLQSQSK